MRLDRRLHRCAAAIASATLLTLAGAGLTASAQAATYTVGTVSDLTGACAKPAAGTCSLRQLIEYEDALAATPNPTDTIVVPAGAYSLSNGELSITQSLAIHGAGARTTAVGVQLRGTPARVFNIQVPGSGGAPTVTISGLEITGGTANENNGFFGGDVHNAGVLTLDEDWITAGRASSGGGISNDTGTLVLKHSLVSKNHANSGGGDSGGIQNHGSVVCGAACFPGKKAVLTVEDSTVAENDARLGAGIFSWSDAADGNQVTIVNSTIADNSTQTEAGGEARGLGAGLLVSDGTAKVSGSILAFNNATIEERFTNSNCSTSEPGTISSAGHNLETEADCGFTSAGDLQNQFGKSLFTGGLEDNGGNTDTLALESTSGAIDEIPTGNSLCTGTDQRGTARPQGAGCDIGAVEMVPLTINATEGASFSGELVTRPPCGIETRVTPTVAWGDGKTSDGTVTETGITASHTYAEEGTYNGTVTYVNDCGTHTSPFQAKVADAPLTATGVAVNATEGVKFTAKVATFTDANPAGTVSEYTATVAWGDGSANSTGTIAAVAGGGFEVKGSHTYTAVGTYKTSVTINDVGGAKATATSTAKVSEPPPGAPIVSSVSVTSVTETTSKIAFKIDPNGADTTYLIEYGPTTSYGQKTTSVDIGSTRGAQSLTKTLTGLNPGKTYHFDVVATNSVAPKGVASSDQTFTTEPDAPLTATGKSVSGTAGVTLSATVATFTDADPAGTVSEYTASIDWGDGSATTTGTISAADGGVFEVQGSHTYAAGGAYKTTVTINDVGGAKATATGSANVIGPPLITGVSVPTVTETTSKIAFEIDPNGADTTYVVEYGPTTSYGQKTTPVDIGSTRGAQSLTKTLTGLEINKTYHFAVVASNSVAPKGVSSGDHTFKTEPDAPLTAAGVTVSATEGVKFTAKVATFTDADPAGTVSEYTATIAWGDGESTAGTIAAASGGGFEVKGTHTYTAVGTYKTTVTINDVGGAKATATSTAKVTEPPPGAPLISSVSVTSVTETTAKIAFNIDPNGTDTTYVIEYGPTASYGQKTTSVDIGSTRGAQSLTKTLTGLNPGKTYHFDVVATNSVAPKGVASGDQTFTTEPDAPLTAAGVTVSATEGVKFTAKVATFTDADPAGTVSEYTATIAWGDGASSAGTIAAASGGGFEVKGSHTYTAGGAYKTTITINDVGGAIATATSTANVTGAPLISGVSVPTVTETSATIAFKIDPNGADTTYVIEYGPTTGYGQKTTPVDIGSTRGAQSLTKTLTGLELDKTYHFAVVAMNSVAPKGTSSGDHTFKTEPDAPLSATGVTVSATEGVKFTAKVASFTDADPAGTVSEYTATIAWGDGESTAGTIAAASGGGFEVKGTHTYTAVGTYKTTVTINDVGGAKATATSTAKVTEPPPSAPLVSSVSVTSVTETSATITFKIDPNGADTTYLIEYGPTTSYGHKTTPVDIGSTRGAQSLTLTIAGLEPNKTYHFDVIAINSVAPTGSGGGDEPFTTVPPPPPAPLPGGPAPGSGILGFQAVVAAPATLATLPPPVLGKIVNVELVSGKVLIALPLAKGARVASAPGMARESLSKGLKFIPLEEARQIPVGSILDTTAGVARIETATANKNKQQFGNFGAGLFKLLQQRKQRGLTEMDIINTHTVRNTCATIGKKASIAKHLSSKTLGRLTGNAHGKFTTRGQYSAATVRGTIWQVTNRCDGTLTHVTRDVVTVRDFHRRKTITLLSGQSYLARARPRR